MVVNVGAELFLAAGLLVTGCRTRPGLAPANLADAGWTVRQGQAVWRSGAHAPEIAGEILVATRTNGESFVQFTKTPFPLVTAQRSLNLWQIEVPTENRQYRGSGDPPGRLIWFWLIRAVEGQSIPPKFAWHQDTNGWSLGNRKSGESVSGYFLANEHGAP